MCGGIFTLASHQRHVTWINPAHSIALITIIRHGNGDQDGNWAAVCAGRGGDGGGGGGVVAGSAADRRQQNCDKRKKEYGLRWFFLEINKVKSMVFMAVLYLIKTAQFIHCPCQFIQNPEKIFCTHKEKIIVKG